MNTNQTLKTTNPDEPPTDAVTRTAQEILAALGARDSAKVASYYAPDAVLATPGRPAVRGGEAVSTGPPLTPHTGSRARRSARTTAAKAVSRTRPHLSAFRAAAAGRGNDHH
jgi:hypothetical protein